MSELSVSEYDGVLVVDSRLVAKRLGIQHESFMRNVSKYKERVEARFGQLRFQIGTVKNSVGAVNEVVYTWLTEPQATTLMTLSRNTDEVIECKFDLVEAFEKAKELLRQRQPRPAYVPYWYERMKVALSDTEKPLQVGYFCVYREIMAFFCELETRLEYLIPDINPITSEHLVPDISIGKRFNDFLRSEDEMPCLARKEFLGSMEAIDFRAERRIKRGLMPEGKYAKEIQMYNHVYPKISHGKYNVQPARSYPEKYLMLFKYFLEQYWISDFFVPYLQERDAQGLAAIRNRTLQMSLTERQALSSTLIGRLVPALPVSV